MNLDLKKIFTIISGLFTGAAFVLSFFAISPAILTALYFTGIATGGIYVVLGALKGLLKQRFLNIDFLVVIATIGAIFINQLPEAAAVVFFFSLSEALEDYGVGRSRKALEALLHKSPQTATLLDGSTKPIADVTVDTVVAVKPGEMIPLDGLITKGISAVNEATITGEPIPKDKREGDAVFGGTLNEQGYLEIKVTKESKNSTFAKIVSLVEQAQKAKAPAQEFIDSFAKYYTPSVIGIAAVISIVPPLALGEPFLLWFSRALILLVIACPCALVIATPVAITSALGGASRRGVLIKGGKYLEEQKKVKAIAFDKTGTLTRGEPYVSDIIAFEGFTEKQVLEDAAGLEQFSSHPLSKSILAFAKEKGIVPHDMSSYENIPGKGGKAVCLVCDDVEHCVGNPKIMDAHDIPTKEVLQKTEPLEREGKTIVLISEGKQVMGALAIADKVRDESKSVIGRLKDLGLTSVMLTGDNEHTASAVSARVGINESHASLLPEQKVEKVRELKEKYGSVAMVGDGVNDAPSLALSNVGIAMGAQGSDVAIETADIALMNDNLQAIPETVSLSRRTVRTIQQNVGAALLAKAVFILLAVFGLATLPVAIMADTGVAILVILNGLRLYNA